VGKNDLNFSANKLHLTRLLVSMVLLDSKSNRDEA